MNIYLTASAGQEPGHSLAGWLWLKVSHETAGRLSAGSGQVRLTQEGSVWSLLLSSAWCSSSPAVPYMAGSFSQSKPERVQEPQKEATVFL